MASLIILLPLGGSFVTGGVIGGLTSLAYYMTEHEYLSPWYSLMLIPILSISTWFYFHLQAKSSKGDVKGWMEMISIVTALGMAIGLPVGRIYFGIQIVKFDVLYQTGIFGKIFGAFSKV